MSPRRPRRRAFTLVELLVVIAIIAALAAMAFPVFAAVRKSARRASCMSSMRQIYVGLRLYMQDADELFPFAVNPCDRAHPDRWQAEDPDFAATVPEMPQFHEVLQPYTRSRQVFRCAADFGMGVEDWVPGWDLDAPSSSYESFGTSYFYRSRLAQAQLGDASINSPSDALVLMDGDGKWHGSASDNFHAAWARRYNLLFADGHVQNRMHEWLAKHGD